MQSVPKNDELKSASENEMNVASRLVVQLTKDVEACGGREVFLSVPTESQYEFSVNSDRFSGFIHPNVIHTLFRHLRVRGHLFIRTKQEPDRVIRAALLTLNGKAVIYVSWH